MSTEEDNAGLYAELDSLREESGELFDDIRHLEQQKQSLEATLEEVKKELSNEIERKAEIDRQIVDLNNRKKAKKIIENEIA